VTISMMQKLSSFNFIPHPSFSFIPHFFCVKL
jgi:hypothetical protein